MTKIDIPDLTGGNGMLLQCPHCNAYNLDTPLLPRGDDYVECLTCGELFTYSFVESCALASTREMLAREFPNLPLDPL
ncbi:hypothetical protein FHW12_000528 [Dokdonella fugitiva]|uniref:Uncharacterized protein n=1 Tax=Dokdonella fugitiva TaxID=328517 RepID=A0A839EPT9_9GAMM|nr:hypothetical protein [Dokdonella fugitiva]MBA8886337.1 hypothetical protein [Dokdonella fugitiva]